MLDFNSDERYDVVLLFECFCDRSDHLRTLEKLRDLTTDSDVVAFAAEQPFSVGTTLLSLESI